MLADEAHRREECRGLDHHLLSDLPDHDGLDDHDKGLSHDLPTLVSRRRALGIIGGLGLAASVAACSSDDAATVGSTDAVGEGEIPEETAGPYPGDGSNGVNVRSRGSRGLPLAL